MLPAGVINDDDDDNDIRHSTRLLYRYLLSYSPGGSTGHDARLRGAVNTPIFGETKVVGVNDATIRKSDGGFL